MRALWAGNALIYSLLRVVSGVKTAPADVIDAGGERNVTRPVGRARRYRVYSALHFGFVCLFFEPIANAKRLVIPVAAATAFAQRKKETRACGRRNCPSSWRLLQSSSLSPVGENTSSTFLYATTRFAVTAGAINALHG